MLDVYVCMSLKSIDCSRYPNKVMVSWSDEIRTGSFNQTHYTHIHTYGKETFFKFDNLPDHTHTLLMIPPYPFLGKERFFIHILRRWQYLLYMACGEYFFFFACVCVCMCVDVRLHVWVCVVCVKGYVNRTFTRFRVSGEQKGTASRYCSRSR